MRVDRDGVWRRSQRGVLRGDNVGEQSFCVAGKPDVERLFETRRGRSDLHDRRRRRFGRVLTLLRRRSELDRLPVATAVAGGCGQPEARELGVGPGGLLAERGIVRLITLRKVECRSRQS